MGSCVTPKDHMGLDRSACTSAVVKNGDWQVAE
jgi:hypothetical protein